VSIDAVQLARRWESNLSAANRFGAWFSLRADGLLANTGSSPDSAEGVATFDRTWSLLPTGVVQIVSARNRVTNAVCKPAASDTDCVVRNTRNWRFVARAGTTLFTIEQAPYAPASSAEVNQSYRFMALSDVGEVK
jgi:hypothetical protein